MGRAGNRPRERDARTPTGRTRRLGSGRRPAGPAALLSRSTASVARAAAGLLALALGLGAAPAAFAQTSVKLVGNTGFTSLTQTSARFTADHAQEFTTGSNAGGYVLTRVHLPIAVVSTAGVHPEYEVSIWSASDDNPSNPERKLATLSRPHTLSTGTHRFTAPDGGLKLESGTKYFVVVDVSDAGGWDVRVRRTNSDNEDGGRASGWSVGNGARLRGTSGIWGGSNDSMQIAVHGYALVAPESGRIEGDRLTLTFPHALDRWSGPAGSAFRVEQGGTTVAAGTGRASVSGVTATVELDRVVPAGTAATVRYARPRAGSGALWGPGGSGDRPPFAAPDFALAVESDEVVAAARFVRATVNGQHLTMHFTEALVVKDASNFGYFVYRDGVHRLNTNVNSTFDSTRKAVTIRVSPPVRAGQTVTLTYLKERGGRCNNISRLCPLRTASGGPLVPSFYDQAVENLTPVPADTAGPRFRRAEIDGDTLTVTFNEALDDSVSVQANAIRLQVGSEIRNSTSVEIAGRTATATFAMRVLHGDVVNAGYQQPGDNNRRIRDPYGNELAADAFTTVTNNTPPNVQSAEVVGAGLTITFRGELDTGSTPAPDAFRVTAGGTRIDVADGGVSIGSSGARVSLTLSAPVISTETVTVGYTPPADNPLRDADNAKNPVAAFANQAVTNSTTADATAPQFVRAEIDGATLTVTFDERLDDSVAVLNLSFQITIDGSAQTASSVSIAGPTAIATYATAAGHGQTVRVWYQRPNDASMRLKDLSGNEVSRFAVQNKVVTNNTPPVFSSAAVNGAALTITFDGGLDTGSVPAAGDFAVTVGGTAVDLAEMDPVAINGAMVTLSLAAAVLDSDTVTVGYTAPETNPLRDADNAMLPVAGFTNRTVTNSTPVDTTQPQFVRADIDGATLTVTFDERLDESVAVPGAAFQITIDGSAQAASSASIAGPTVIATYATAARHGQAVRVWYQRPNDASMRLKDPSDNEVPRLAVQNAIVTNNTPSGPFVTGLAFAGTAPHDADGNGDADTYGPGDAIELTATFSEAVTVTGTPSLTVQVGANARQATFASGGGTTALTFSYTVAADDADADGVSVAVGSITLNGGTLKDAANNDASLAHDAIAPDAARKVDGALPPPADTTAPKFSSAARTGTRSIVITFDEALAAAPRLTNGDFRVRAGTQPVSLTGSPSVAGRTVTLSTQTDLPASGSITVRYIRPDRGTVNKLRDAAGNEVATFTNPDFRAVSNSAVAPGTPAAVTVAEGDTADSLAVSWTAPSNPGSSAITRYDLQWAEWAEGATGGAYRWRDGPSVAGTEMKTTIAGLKRSAVYRVRVRATNDDGTGDWSEPGEGRTWGEQPRVEWVRFTSTPRRDMDGDGKRETYGQGEDIEVTVAFNRDVVWNAPGSQDLRVRLDVGGQVEVARLVKGGETTNKDAPGRTLKFTKRVSQTIADRGDADGVQAVLKDGLIVVRLGGATIKDAYRDQFANLELGRYESVLAPDPGHKVASGSSTNDAVTPKVLATALEGNTVALVFDKQLATPSATEKAALNFAFFVMGALGQAADPNTARSPQSVEVNGNRVVLDLGQPDVTAAPETIRVFYQPGSGNLILRDAAGNPVAPFDRYLGSGEGGQQGTDTTPPRLVRAAVWATGAGAAETVLRLTFDEPLKANSKPAASAFRVDVRNAVTSLPGSSGTSGLQGTGPVTIAGPDVTVRLAGGIAQDDSVYVSYDAPDADPRLQDAAGNAAASLAQDPVIVVDATSPVLVAGSLHNDDDDMLKRITLVYDEALDADSTPAGRDFEVRVGNAASTVDAVAVSSVHAADAGSPTPYEKGFGGAVTLTLADAVTGAGDVTVSYTARENPVRDRAGNPAGSFAGQGLDREAASAPGAPVLVADSMEPVVADGALVTLTFNQRLDPESVPARDRFKFYYHGGATDFVTSPFDTADTHGAAPFAVNAVSVDGARVLLRLNGPPPRCMYNFRMKYLKPTANPLQNLFDEAVAQIGSTPAVWSQSMGQRDLGKVGINRNGLSRALHGAAFEAGGSCVLTARPGAQGLRRESGTGGGTGTVNGKSVIVGTDGTAGRTTRAPGSAFEVTATAPGGQSRTIAGTGMARMTDGTVTVTLAGAVAGGERVTLSYARAAGDPPLRDAEGKVLGDFSGLALANEAPPAAVQAVAVELTSHPGADGAYAPGETVRATLTFGAAVDVSGAPRLRLDLDPADGGERWAAYESGTGTAQLVFAWTVVEPDASAGVAVLADTLELNGGAIAAAHDGAAAALAHAGLAPDPDHRVDGKRPRVLQAGINGHDLTLTFDEDLAPVTEASKQTELLFRLFVKGIIVGAEQSPARVAVDGATAALRLNTAAQAGQQVTLSYDAGDSGPLRDAAGNKVAAFTDTPVANRTAAPGTPANSPATGAPAIAGTAQVGETLTAETAGIADADGLSGAVFAFQWRSDDADIAGATAASYTLADADEGNAVTVRVTFTDDGGNAESLTSAATQPVAPRSNRPATGAPAIAGTVQVGQTLTASTNGIADPDGLTRATFAYQWHLDGGDGDLTIFGVQGMSGASFTLTDADEGRTVKVRVTFTDDAGHTETLMSAATEPVAPRSNRPATGAPAVAGTAQAGQTLTVSTAGIADADGLTQAVFAYQWLSDDAGIAGAAGASYNLADADVGKRIRVRVTFTDDRGHAETLTSAATAAVLARPLTASFIGVPAEHDGRTAFSFELRFSDNFPGRLSYKVFKDHALQVTNGRAIGVRRAAPHQNQRWIITVRPWSAQEVTVTLAAGSVSTESGRRLSNTVTARVLGPPLLSVADAEAREGSDEAVEFAVSLSRAASGPATVDYATADGTAVAGEDYTATSGTLTFAAGEREKTVAVPILDDARDEGRETFLLRLSNARGAVIADGEATGTIANSDPLQRMWLSRFGRTVAGHVVDAVSERLAAPLTGAQVTVGGQSVDLERTDDGAWLGRTLTSVARALGAAEGPAPGGGGWPGTGLGLRESPAAGGAPARELSGRELLLGSAFHLAREGDGGGPGLAAWGRVTAGGFDGEAPADAGNVRMDGEVTTGILGADASWRRLLAGVAVSLSEGEGAFDQRGVDSGAIESTMTTVSPYARMRLSERVSVWGLAGYGTGDMTIVQAANDRGQPRRVTRTDIGMRLAAVGGRGALLEAGETGGVDLALKADAFVVETESEAVSNEGSTKADASRVRLMLEGSRAFAAGGGVLTPGLELGLRHDGGDAETGTGVEVGGRIAWAAAGSGLSVEAGVRALVAHEDSGYEEWGASGSVRLAPDASGRGLSFSLAPTWGAPSSGIDRLWSARDARGLSPGGEFEPGRRLEGEIGYGLAVPGGRFTGTPNMGFGLSDTAREYRIGWRLTPALKGGSGFEVNLDAARKESADAPVEHGVMLRAAIRW